MTARAPLLILKYAAVAVGNVFGTEPECAHAAALLKMTADHLGYDLTPRPVSLVATDRTSDSKVFMGPRADALIEDTDRGNVEFFMPEEGDTGHMVLTSEHPLMLFDPNLAQLQRHGIYAETLYFPIASTHPTDRRWNASRGSLDLLYLPDENPALWDTYNDALVDFASKARELAAILRKGFRPEQLQLRPKQ